MSILVRCGWEVDGERARRRYGRREVRRRKGRMRSSQKVYEFEKKEREWRRGRKEVRELRDGRGSEGRGEKRMMEREEEREVLNIKR